MLDICFTCTHQVRSEEVWEVLIYSVTKAAAGRRRCVDGIAVTNLILVSYINQQGKIY